MRKWEQWGYEAINFTLKVFKFHNDDFKIQFSYVSEIGNKFELNQFRMGIKRRLMRTVETFIEQLY